MAEDPAELVIAHFADETADAAERGHAVQGVGRRAAGTHADAGPMA